MENKMDVWCAGKVQGMSSLTLTPHAYDTIGKTHENTLALASKEECPQFQSCILLSRQNASSLLDEWILQAERSWNDNTELTA